MATAPIHIGQNGFQNKVYQAIEKRTAYNNVM